MKNISQPVVIIGNLLVNQRGRFEIKETFDTWVMTSLLKVTDTKTGKHFVVYDGSDGYATILYEDWMTADEKVQLGSLVVKIHKREEEERREALRQKERSEWLDAYSEDL